jgi:hypothetical protein
MTSFPAATPASEIASRFRLPRRAAPTGLRAKPKVVPKGRDYLGKPFHSITNANGVAAEPGRNPFRVENAPDDRTPT